MIVTTIDNYRLDPGEYVEWSVHVSSSALRPSSVPPSFNQAFHLAGAVDSAVWLAASFDVDGPLDLDALGRAYRSLIARHATLRSGFTLRGEHPARVVFNSSEVALRRNPTVATGSADEQSKLVRAALDAVCRPLRVPSYLFAAVSRPGRSTVVCGFDHAHVDAFSIAVVIDDLDALYRGEIGAGPGLPRHDKPGSFVEYCRLEARAAPVADDDPRLRTWHDFIGSHGNSLPQFPLDLGVAPGERAPQAVDMRVLLDADGTTEFESFCRANGGSVYAGALAAMAHTAQRMGSEVPLAMVVPLHTRHRPEWQDAVGWFTTNVPLTVECADTPGDTVRRIASAMPSAFACAEVPLAQVLASVPGGLRPARSDVLMASYIDYRRLPRHRAHGEINAQHVSNVTAADDAQFWFSRTDRGLALRTRFPSTDRAHSTMSAFLATLGIEMSCTAIGSASSAG